MGLMKLSVLLFVALVLSCGVADNFLRGGQWERVTGAPDHHEKTVYIALKQRNLEALEAIISISPLIAILPHHNSANSGLSLTLILLSTATTSIVNSV